MIDTWWTALVRVNEEVVKTACFGGLANAFHWDAVSLIGKWWKPRKNMICVTKCWCSRCGLSSVRSVHQYWRHHVMWRIRMGPQCLLSNFINRLPVLQSDWPCTHIPKVHCSFLFEKFDIIDFLHIFDEGVRALSNLLHKRKIPPVPVTKYPTPMELSCYALGNREN